MDVDWCKHQSVANSLLSPVHSDRKFSFRLQHGDQRRRSGGNQQTRHPGSGADETWTLRQTDLHW